MTPQQREALAARINDHTVQVRINHAPFDLPPGYLYVIIVDHLATNHRHELHYGISPEGAVSS